MFWWSISRFLPAQYFGKLIFDVNVLISDDEQRNGKDEAGQVKNTPVVKGDYRSSQNRKI